MNVGRSLWATWGRQCFVVGLDDLELTAPVGQTPVGKLRPPRPPLPTTEVGPAWLPFEVSPFVWSLQPNCLHWSPAAPAFSLRMDPGDPEERPAAADPAADTTGGESRR